MWTDDGSRSRSPRALGFRQPAEWELHEAVWLAWPSHDDLWEGLLPDVQREWLGLCEAIADVGPDGRPRGERLRVLVPDARREREACNALAKLDAGVHRLPFGDIWLRDTGPVFLSDGRDLAPLCFRFNGWGGRYVLEGDAELGARVARLAGGPGFRSALVCEGGAVESDGEGTLLTTRQCLLNANRNPGRSEAFVEKALCEALGGETVLWLDEGLRNDHTDGHVDTLARFVAPGRVVCMEAREADDPNGAVLAAVARRLAELRDHAGRRLQVETVPSPGAVLDPEDQSPLPASYVNFYVANTTVVVPTYGVPSDAEAVEAIGALVPGRRTVGCPARAILAGGGAFHCITQQQPRASGA